MVIISLVTSTPALIKQSTHITVVGTVSSVRGTGPTTADGVVAGVVSVAAGIYIQLGPITRFFLRQYISCSRTQTKEQHKLKVNPLHAQFFRGIINIYLHFMSLLHIKMTQVIEILHQLK